MWFLIHPPSLVRVLRCGGDAARYVCVIVWLSVGTALLRRFSDPAPRCCVPYVVVRALVGTFFQQWGSPRAGLDFADWRESL